MVSQLLAHMDVYIQNGMLNQAFKILLFKRHYFKSSKISTVAIYNMLLEAYITKPHLEKIFEIYNLLKKDSVKPNAQTYALMFQIIGKMKAYRKQAGESFLERNIEIIDLVLPKTKRISCDYSSRNTVSRIF